MYFLLWFSISLFARLFLSVLWKSVTMQITFDDFLEILTSGRIYVLWAFVCGVWVVSKKRRLGYETNFNYTFYHHHYLQFWHSLFVICKLIHTNTRNELCIFSFLCTMKFSRIIMSARVSVSRLKVDSIHCVKHD